MKHVDKILLILLLIPLLGSTVSYGQNLISNGGFENGLSSWWTQSTNGGVATFEIDTDDKVEGLNSFNVTVTSPGVNAWDVQAVNTTPWPSVAGTNYVLSFYAKAATTGSSFRAIMQVDGEGGSYADRTINLSENWEKYEWEFTALSNNLQLKFHFNNPGDFHIDNILIPSGEGETEFVELLQNGNFEMGSGNSFTHWWLNQGNGTATFSEETTDVQEGNRALKVDVDVLGTNPWEIQAVNSTSWPSETGKSYKLTFSAKAVEAGSQFRAVMQIGGAYAEEIFTMSKTWQQYEWDFTADADNLELKFQFLSTGTFYIDNASILVPASGNNGGPSAGENKAIVFEAESGTIMAASDPPAFLILNEGDIEFVRVQEDFLATNFPGNTNRMTSYSVTFPEPGEYNLYSRLRVGPGNFNDDSFYIGNGFGTKSATEPSHWIVANNLASAGFNTPSDLVAGNGLASNNIWKWVNLSDFTGLTFNVTEDNLTQTFQIGSRENGLDLDKFAFGLKGVFFTVANLDNNEAGTTTPPPPPFTPTGDPIADGKSKWLGNVYSTSQIPFFENYWNQVTPENAGKWGSVEATRDVMNWGELDASYNFAKSNGFPFRFHVLIWGNQQPGWIESLSTEEQREEIEEWFAAVAERYPNIDYLEVVNEPLHDPPAGATNGNYIDALGGTGETGWDWVLESFRLARHYFPNTPLAINEYSITNSTSEANRYIEIIQLLQKEGLIDIVGIQGHAFSTRVPASVTAANLEHIATTTRLPIQVTELDIDGPTDQIHLEDYQRIFPVFWENPSVMGITLWGWKPGMWRTPQGAYLALENGAERPALVWLREYVEGYEINTRPVITPSQEFAIDGGICNELGVVAATNADGNTIFQNWQITGGDGASIFTMDANSGLVSIANPSLIDFTKTSYSLEVVVSDGRYSSFPEIVTISISDRLIVCHKDKKVIPVSKNAAAIQLRKGGCLGACEGTNDTQTANFSESEILLNSGIRIYPNPVKDHLNIALGANEMQVRSIEIWDLTGKRVMEVSIGKTESNISLACDKLPARLYILRIIGDRVTNQKLILE